jgi:hypothetical protein
MKVNLRLVDVIRAQAITNNIQPNFIRVVHIYICMRIAFTNYPTAVMNRFEQIEKWYEFFRSQRQKLGRSGTSPPL